MNDIQQSRLWVIGGAVATIVILLMGYLLLISPQLTTAETIRGDTQLALDRNTAMEARITQLRAANENLDELQTDLEAARRELPVRNETEVFASTLQNLGEKNLVSVTSISFGDPENVTSRAQGTVAAAPGAAATEESDAAAAADAAATAAAEAQARQTFAL
ncbi:MAG: hypothetical protein JWQ43_3598, partial [Glaciihabitans sp.]|nr:hypothetical protein [Glaciihabitans sp.]